MNFLLSLTTFQLGAVGAIVAVVLLVLAAILFGSLDPNPISSPSRTKVRFAVTQAAFNHAVLALLVSLTTLLVGLLLSDSNVGFGSLLFCFVGFAIWLGRETCDLEKRYRWKVTVRPDGSHWNSAELILPLLTNLAIAAGVFLSLILPGT